MLQNRKLEFSELDTDTDGLSRGQNEKSGAFSPKTGVDIAALIRSIQRADGHTDCFRGGKGHCDQIGCVWRAYCLPQTDTH